MSGKKPPKPATRTLPLPDNESTMVGTAPPGWAEAVQKAQAEAQADADLAEGLEDRTDPGQQNPTLIGPGADYALVNPTIPAQARAEPVVNDPQSRPPVEVEVRRISSTASVTRKAPPAFEIWTKNRVYALDSSLRCVEVIDLASGRTEVQHPFIGAQLVGGQMRVGDNNELSFPLPTPGAESVFQTTDPAGRPRLSVTSRVTRVLLHVQVVKVSEKQRDDTWDVITSSRRPQ
jgi:hypothetical protein